MLKGRGLSTSVPHGIRHHHQNFDGDNGYPFENISGYRIHVYGRMLRIFDSFDAGTSERPGKKAKPLPEMIVDMHSKSGEWYDPELLDMFISMINPICKGEEVVLGYDGKRFSSYVVRENTGQPFRPVVELRGKELDLKKTAPVHIVECGGINFKEIFKRYYNPSHGEWVRFIQ